MTIEQELRLSYYREVAQIDPEHSIFLVQDVRDRKFYVKKLLTVYNADIYRHLLAHPVAHTPRLLLAEEDGGVLTVIEEYIPGDTLEELLAKQGLLPEGEVLDITMQLCGILSSFHACTPPIVNRDIKPSNIKRTPDGVVKLLDLNAAKWSGGQAEKDTVLLGTQGYAAPEQYGFGPSSVLTDIYAVGVLMNVLLTGQLPGRQLAPGRLGDIIRRCVELSPGARFQSIGQLRAALEACIAAPKEPVQTPGWRRFLPPGYRGRNGLTWLLSTLGYAFLVYLCVSLEVENAGPLETLLNRICITASLLAIVLFSGNYMDCHRHFPLVRSSIRPVRWLGVFVVDFTLLSLGVIAAGILMALFVR